MYTVDFYFDFLSPYSYLAFHLLFKHFLPLWRQHHPSLKLLLKPVSLPHLIARSGNSPPASVPARRAYLLKDLQRGAQYYGLEPFKMPPHFPFDTRKMLMAAVEAGDVEAFAQQWWSKIFGEGRSDFIAQFQVRDAEASKAVLMRNTEEALERGAFGVPFFVVEDDDGQGREECFFGSDRFHYISSFLGISQHKL